MAARIKDATGAPHVELLSGDRGEFSIWVGDEVVAKKGPLGYPSEEKIVRAVSRAMAAGAK